MTVHPMVVPVDANGDIVAWKAIVGGRASHRMARPVFPRHSPNFNLDKGVLIRIKAWYRPTGSLPLDEEYANR